MKKKAFTLIELLVVIAIIGILVALGTAAYGTARTQARDAKRQSDLKQIQNALQLYFNENGSYPSINWVNSSAGGTWISGLDGRYIGKLPTDPKNTTGCSLWDSRGTSPNWNSNCFQYAYYSSDWTTCGGFNGRTYILATRLETYTGSDLSQKPYYKPNGDFCSNWSESPYNGLYVVQP